MRYDPSTPVAVFLGPSLARSRAADLLPANYYPPVQKWDIYRLIGTQVRVIVILDGLFHGAPAVWQREILDALDEGIPERVASPPPSHLAAAFFLCDWAREQRRACPDAHVERYRRRWHEGRGTTAPAAWLWVNALTEREREEGIRERALVGWLTESRPNRFGLPFGPWRRLAVRFAPRGCFPEQWCGPAGRGLVPDEQGAALERFLDQASVFSFLADADCLEYLLRALTKEGHTQILRSELSEPSLEVSVVRVTVPTLRYQLIQI